MAPRADELNQAIALKAIEMVFEWLPRAVQDGNDLMPRIKMQQAAMMAGNPLCNAGSGISHAFGHTIGGLFHIHHGAMVLCFSPTNSRFIPRPPIGTWKYAMLGIRDKTSEKRAFPISSKRSAA